MRFLALKFGCVFFGTLVALAVQGQENQTRLWQDASGKFQVRAVLLEQTDTTARLRTEDGREVSVPIVRLGQSDQRYLKSLLAPTDNPFAGGVPVADRDASRGGARDASTKSTDQASTQSRSTGLRMLADSPSVGDEMALPGTGNTLDLGATPQRSFAADPAPRSSEFAETTISVSGVDAYDKVSPPIIIDNSGHQALISIGRNVSGRPAETRGRIYAVDLNNRAADLVWDEPSAVRLLGHDTATGRTLVVAGLDQFQRGGDLVMLDGMAIGQPQTLYRRGLPGAGKPGFAPQVEWAKLLSGSHAAVIVDGSLHVWDLPAARLIYRIERVGVLPPPALSPGGTFLAIPENGGAVIIDTASGEACSRVEFPGLLKPGVAFSPDGRRLLLCAGNQYRVWDAVDQNVVAEATTTDHLGSHPMNWVGPKTFLSQLGDLVHLDLGMSIWKYSTPSTTEPVVAGGSMLVATSSRQCDIIGIHLPHAAADQAFDKLMQAGDSAMLVRPGTEVAIAVETTVDGVDSAAITDALSEAVAKAGWKVGGSPAITLVAKIGRGEPQELRYRSMLGPNRSESKATLNPFTAELEIRRGSDVLWKRSTSNHVPPMLRLEEGETVQDAVKRYEKPDSAFFARLQLPPRIARPEISQQVGRSMLKDGRWHDLNTSAAAPPVRRPSRFRGR